MDDDETDADDKNFAEVSSTEDGSDANDDIMEISNEEVNLKNLSTSVPTSLTLSR